MQYINEIIFLSLLVVCVPAAIVPGIPTLFVMLSLSLIYGYFDGFVHMTVPNLIVLFFIAALSFTFEMTAGIVGAKYGGADKKSLLYGWIGLILGTFIIPIPVVGSVIGLFLGVFLSELIALKKNKNQALKSAVGGIVGALAGTFGNIFMAVLFLALSIWFVLT